MKKLLERIFGREKNSISPEEKVTKKYLKKVSKSSPDFCPYFEFMLSRFHQTNAGLEFLNQNPVCSREYAKYMVERKKITPEIEAAILAYDKSSNLLYDLKAAGYRWTDQGIKTIQKRFPYTYGSLMTA